MSKFAPTPYNCPRCGAEFLAGTAESINVTRMPRARERILEGRFHRFDCAKCGERITIDRVVMYIDMRREHFIHVFPVDHEAGWPEWEQVAGETFWRSFGTGPAAMQEVAPRYKVRAVFGLDALADKLRVWDAGLDDAVVELQKLELFTGAPALRERGDVAIDVTAIDEQQIEVRARSVTGAWPPLDFALARARHDQLAASRDDLLARYPGLFLRPYVGFRRLARETLAPDAPPTTNTPEEGQA